MIGLDIACGHILVPDSIPTLIRVTKAGEPLCPATVDGPWANLTLLAERELRRTRMKNAFSYNTVQGEISALVLSSHL